MSIKKVTLPILAVRVNSAWLCPWFIRQRGKSAAKGIILFHTKLCFTVDQYNSSGALMNVCCNDYLIHQLVDQQKIDQQQA